MAAAPVDYFITDSRLSTAIADVTARTQYRISPHSPVDLLLNVDLNTTWVAATHRPPRLPDAPPFGPAPAPDPRWTPIAAALSHLASLAQAAGHTTAASGSAYEAYAAAAKQWMEAAQIEVPTQLGADAP